MDEGGGAEVDKSLGIPQRIFVHTAAANWLYTTTAECFIVAGVNYIEEQRRACELLKILCVCFLIIPQSSPRPP